MSIRPFKVLNTSDLISVLAEYTERYTSILAKGGSEKEMINCKETIESLIAEIKIRKQVSQDDPSSHENR